MAIAVVKKDRKSEQDVRTKQKRKTRKSASSTEAKMNELSARRAIGVYIRERREQLGLTQATAGEAAKIPHPAFSAFETGKRNITPMMAKRLARGLKMQPADLMAKFQELRGLSGAPAPVPAPSPKAAMRDLVDQVAVQPGTIEMKFPAPGGVDIRVVIAGNGGTPTNAALVEAAQGVIADLGSRVLPG